MGPTIARDITRSAFIAVFLALLMIFAYIAWRFKGWTWGLGGVVSLAHTSWYSSPRGLREKYNPAQHDFALPADFVKALDRYDGPVNFLTDNDITGGNSGSPVLNARGEVIGLAFDGNKESLASDVSFTPDYNKCVCVDIRYVLWILEDYVGLERIVKEIE